MFFELLQVPAFVAAQLAGSTLAILTLAQMFDDPKSISWTVTHYSTPVNAFRAFAWEFIISFNLMLTICGVAADARAVSPSSYNFAALYADTLLINSETDTFFKIFQICLLYLL